MPWGQIGLVVLGAVVGAIATAWRQNWLARRQHLRERRAELYNELLAPYAQALAEPDDPEILEYVQSADYYKHRFKFVAEAEDDLIREHNDMLAKFRELEGGGTTDEDVRTSMAAVADLLLKVRKGMGNKGTGLTRAEVLEGIGITDARQYFT